MFANVSFLPQVPALGSVTVQLPRDAVAFAQDVLPPWTSGVTIEDRYVLTSPSTLPGIFMLRKPLWSDERTGSVLMPILMGKNTVYPEHGHRGLKEGEESFGEDALVMNAEGELVDANGTYRTSSDYHRTYGTQRFRLHTLRAVTPTFFFGVAHGDVFMTGLKGEHGKELLGLHEIEASSLEQLFAGVDRGKPTHQLSTAFFGSLAAVTGTEQETTFFDGGVRGWLTSLIGRDPPDRVADAREIFGRLRGHA